MVKRPSSTTKIIPRNNSTMNSASTGFSFGARPVEIRAKGIVRLASAEKLCSACCALYSLAQNGRLFDTMSR
jgi:hypothetical protein